MAKIKQVHAGMVSFYCPGCETNHAIRVRVPEKVYDHVGAYAWEWNNDFNKPTFAPSILLKTGHYIDGKPECWCTFEERFNQPSPFSCSQCHSFIRNGRIEFLSDCSHSLAGQTIELPDIE